MDYNGFEFDAELKQTAESATRGGRLPHALIIESPDSGRAERLAVLLSMTAVCAEENKPCCKCKNCLNAERKNHPDIFYMELPPKKKQYSVDQMRGMIKDAYILPNEAQAKVYILKNCDEWFPATAQNTFLKLSEEPPENVLFLLLCKNSQSLLETIRSRFTVIRLRGTQQTDEKAREAAQSIIAGITETREYPLLKALGALRDKERAPEILAEVKLCLRDALAVLSGGKVLGDPEAAKLPATRLTRKKIIEMIELCDSSDNQIKQNVNINLLVTRMCGEFRRITWQK